MNAEKCMEWCLEYGHRFPEDRRTAMHVRDWLADKAESAAVTDDERGAVEAARKAARDILSEQGVA